MVTNKAEKKISCVFAFDLSLYKKIKLTKQTSPLTINQPNQTNRLTNLGVRLKLQATLLHPREKRAHVMEQAEAVVGAQ
jgi:hypothetical protein